MADPIKTDVIKAGPNVPPVPSTLPVEDKDRKRREEENKKEKEERKVMREDLLKQAQDILAKFDNQESNIPVNHGYWDLMNQFRGLNRDVDTETLREKRNA